MTLFRSTLSRTLQRTAIGLAAVATMTLVGAGPATAGPAPDPAAGCSSGRVLLVKNSDGQQVGRATVEYGSGNFRYLCVDDQLGNGLQFGLRVHVPDGRTITYVQQGTAASAVSRYTINYPVSWYQACDGLNIARPTCGPRVYD